MSANTITGTPVAAHEGPTVSTLVAVIVRTAVVALVANVLVHTLARVAGVETVLTPPGAAPVTVAPFSVVTMTIIPVVVGGLLLVLASRFAPGAVRSLPWIGLFIGIGTAVMPLSMGGALDGRLVLAAMHVITGIAWFVSVRRVQA